jgi:hypothetical protein
MAYVALRLGAVHKRHHAAVRRRGGGGGGRSLHSYTFRLNVSTFCGIRWVHDFLPVY